jgi:hypothetical protein
MIKFKDSYNVFYNFELKEDFLSVKVDDHFGSSGCTISYNKLAHDRHFLLSEEAYFFIKKVLKNKAFL